MNAPPVALHFEQAWQIIKTMQTQTTFPKFLIVVHLSCFLSRSVIKAKTKEWGYLPFSSPIKKEKIPFPLNVILFPFPRANRFYLYDIHLNHICDLAWASNRFLNFEILIMSRENTHHIDLKNTFFPSSDHSLFDDFTKLGFVPQNFFLCGLNFDASTVSGISQTLHHNFVPNFLSHYFP